VGPSLNARPAIVGAAAAAVVALIAHPMPFKLGLFCGAIAGILAATIADAAQQRAAPAEGT
jgi:predicted branched-subunit amino acid permease